MMSTAEGLIIKGLGGFYYVEDVNNPDTVYECRGRGVLRGRGVTPTVGDRCRVTVQDSGLCAVDSIAERKNILVRPAVANLDRLFIVVSSCKPRPNLQIIDRIIAAAEYNDIEPVLVMTKLDLGDLDEVSDIYKRAGFKALDNTDIEGIKAEMAGKICAFAGNSGVGKSTLLNAICPGIAQKTGETSEKLGRGRHTTRSVELFRLPFGGRIADTPGFSSFDGDLGTFIPAEKLELCFREFEPYLGKCRYTSCAHVKEAGCAVLAAVEAGEISAARHDSYAAMYAEAKEIKPWMI